MNKKSPIITKSLVLINVLIHVSILVYTMVIKKDPILLQDIYFKFGLIPAEFWNGAVWQPFTSMFLHGYQVFSLHLVINMLALWSLGSAIEMTIGSIAFVWLYTVSGLFGSLSVIWFQPDLTIPTAGASGAIMGLLSALAIFYPNSTLLVLFFPMKARTVAIIFGVGSLIFALIDHTSYISHFGHLGGLIGGFLYTRLALKLKIGKHKLIPMDHQKGSDDIKEKIQNIHKIRENFREKKWEEQLWLDLLNSTSQKEDIQEQNPPSRERVKKIYFDPATGKFYIGE